MKVKKCFKPKSLSVHRLEVEQALSKISMTDLPQTNGGERNRKQHNIRCSRLKGKLYFPQTLSCTVTTFTG